MTPNPERNDRILELADGTRSAAEIAWEVGNGCTKNMVMGVVHRAQARGVDARLGPTTASLTPKVVAQPRPSAAPSNGCQWIFGHPSIMDMRRGQVTMCGAPRVLGRSYCPAHEEAARGKLPARTVTA